MSVRRIAGWYIVKIKGCKITFFGRDRIETQLRATMTAFKQC